MRGYSLLHYSSVLDAVQSFLGSLTDIAKGWRRSIRSIGGFWQGSFSVTGDLATLRGYFDTWLGTHLVERCKGMVSWEGMLYELELLHAGTLRRRSLDDIRNATRSTYTTMQFSGDNLVLNPGYESLGGGGLDAFQSWEEEAGTSGWVEAASGVGLAHAGTYSCKITKDSDGLGGAGEPNTRCKQNLNVTAGARYRWTFWTRGDGTHAGQYAVRDPNAAVWLVAITSTGVTGATWTQKTVEFTGPSESEVVLWLMAGTGTGDIAYFDDNEVLEKLEVVLTSTWALSTPSILRYGRHEETLILDRYPQATAESLRDKELAVKAWPWARPVSMGQSGAATLNVRACGYIFTANWLHVAEGDGTDHDFDHWIRAMLGSAFGLSTNHGGSLASAGDCQFLMAGALSQNTLQVTEEVTMAERPFDRMRELTELGGTGGVPWRLWCGEGRLVHYRAIGLTPRYYMRGGALYSVLSDQEPVTPWLVKPCVVRDVSYPVNRTETGSWLSDARDIYLEEIEVDENGVLTPRPMLYNEADLLAAQLERLQK